MLRVSSNVAVLTLEEGGIPATTISSVPLLPDILPSGGSDSELSRKSRKKILSKKRDWDWCGVQRVTYLFLTKDE
eukprot:jgi/Mesen1/2434/ME000157S01572